MLLTNYRKTYRLGRAGYDTFLAKYDKLNADYDPAISKGCTRTATCLSKAYG